MKFIKIFENVCLSYLLKFFLKYDKQKYCSYSKSKFQNCCDVDNELVLNWSNKKKKGRFETFFGPI